MFEVFHKINDKTLAVILAGSLLIGLSFGPRLAVALCPQKLKINHEGEVVQRLPR